MKKSFASIHCGAQDSTPTISSAAAAILFRLRFWGLSLADTCRSGEIAACANVAATPPLRRPAGLEEEVLRVRPEALLLLGIEPFVSVRVPLLVAASDRDLQQ